MTQPLAMTRDTVTGVPVLSLAGDLVHHDLARLTRALCLLLRPPAGFAVVDVSRLQAPSRADTLLTLPSALGLCGGWPAVALHLAAPGVALAEALHGTHVDRYLPIHSTFAEALFSAELDGAGHHDEITLAAVPQSLRTARRTVADAWTGPASRRDDAVLVASEMAENVVDHVGGSFTVAVACTPLTGLVAVSDDSADEPILAVADSPLDAGLGLRLIASICQSWGVTLRMPRGKTVWATLDAFATET